MGNRYHVLLGILAWTNACSVYSESLLEGSLAPAGVSTSEEEPRTAPPLEMVGPEDLTSLVDDFTDQNGVLLPSDGRFGHWRVTSDGSPQGRMSPAPGEPFLPESIDGTEDYGLHLTATGYSVWGAGAFVLLADGEPYDLSGRGFRRIAFRAKATEGSSRYLRVAIADTHSSDRGACASPCQHDHAGAWIQLNEEFSSYEVQISELARLASPEPLDPSTAYELHFMMNSDSIDFWVDDITFLP